MINIDLKNLHVHECSCYIYMYNVTVYRCYSYLSLPRYYRLPISLPRYAYEMCMYVIGAAHMDVEVILYACFTSEVGFFFWLCAPLPHL